MNENIGFLGKAEFRVKCKKYPQHWQVTSLTDSKKIRWNQKAYFLFLINPGRGSDSELLREEIEWSLETNDRNGNWLEIGRLSKNVNIFRNQDRKRLIIDKDPAMGKYTVNDIDDGLAMIYAYQQPVEIAGVTVTWGNLSMRHHPFNLLAIMPDTAITRSISDTELAYQNAIAIKAHLGGRYNVVKGSTTKFEPQAIPQDEATDFLIEKVLSEPGEYTIVALGNLTNIANAMKKEPNFSECVREIYIVAGWIEYPLFPEWNILYDPEASAYVLKHARRAFLIPFDATTDWIFTEVEFNEIMKHSNCMTSYLKKPISDWLNSGISHLVSLVKGRGLIHSAFFPFDSVGMAISIDNNLATTMNYFPVSLEWQNKQTVKLDDLNYDGRSALTVVYDYKIYGKDGFRDRFLKALTNPKPCEGKVTDGTALALIIDSTGSMRFTDPQNTRVYAGELVLDQAKDDWEIGIVDFDTSSKLLGSGSPKDKSLRDSLRQIDSEGFTNIQIGLEEGFHFLQRATQKKKGAILLTDGGHNTPSDEFDYSKYVNIFAQNGWPVYTIGLTGEANALLLSKIASITGGTYLKANSSQDMVAIIDLILSQFKKEGLLVHHKDKIRQGETKEFSFTVDKSVRSMTYSGTYIGSKVDFSLVNPQGEEISETELSKGIEVITGEVYKIIKVNNPIGGHWKSKAVGIDVSEQGEPFEIKISAETPIMVDIEGAKPSYYPFEPIKLKVNVTGDVDMDSISGSAEVTPPEGSSEHIILGRDFSIEYKKTEKPGVYYFNVELKGRKKDGEQFMREGLKHIVVGSTGAEFGVGKVIKRLGGYIEIDMGKEVGIRPGMKIFVFSTAKGKKEKIAEGYAISVLPGKSVVEITQVWGSLRPEAGFRVEIERVELRK